MASTQRSTRRSSARLEDADDAPPPKKQKLDQTTARATGKQANGKKAVGAKTSSKVYDSNEDDFTFTRKPKKTQKAKAPEQPISEEPSAQVDEISEPAPKPKSRKRASGSPSAKRKDHLAPEPTRRSKRLSGDVEPPSEEAAKEPQKETRRGREKQRSPEGRAGKAAETPQRDEEGGLRVDKKRRETKIALPFQDTPVIQRNREMRQTSAENRRRSSSTFRGRRASSLIDSGTSNAVPHANVPVTEFYKHISNDMPEPRRMRQLLTWCGSRALTERPGEKSKGDVNAILAARAIQDELLKDFTNKSEMSDWYTREDEVKPAVLVKKPNPRNVQNAAKLQELEAEVQRLEQEKSQWDSLLSGLSQSLQREATASKQTQPALSQVNPDQAAYAKLLPEDPSSSTAARARSRLKDASTALEFKIDTFADGVHKLNMLDEVARERAEGVMTTAFDLLKQRQDASAASSGGAKHSVGDLLKALSRTGG